MTEDYIIPATSKLIARKITVSVSSSGNQGIQQHRHASSDQAVRGCCRPNWRACEELAALVVNASAPCGQARCALGTPQPFTEQPLYALTGDARLNPKP